MGVIIISHLYYYRWCSSVDIMSAVFSDAEESLGTGIDRQVNKLTGKLRSPAKP